MGAYVNPQRMSKKQFLRRKGDYIGMQPPSNHTRQEDGETQFAVCLVDNGPFRAAGIMYAPRELEAFSRDDDPRPKRWYWVSKDDLLPVSDLENFL